MDNFTKHYLITALWSSTNENGENLDEKFTIDEIAEETKIAAQNDCNSFREKAGSFLDELDEEVVAHDFWLTRNHHGAGFWDGDYEDNVGVQLTAISHEFAEVDLYLGDDGLIHS